MPKLLKNRQVSESSLHVLTTEQLEQPLPTGDVLLPAQAARSQSVAQQVGIWFDSDGEPEALADSLHEYAVIGVHFPVFTDGRGYSIARLLRDQLGYRGDIRAIGDVLVDQIHYLHRCGFSSFCLREDQNPDDAMVALAGFSAHYQAGTDDSAPLYRRR